ncbi:MAG: hypothetical protein EPO24_08970 [Bacteroidetes bacterium]|nr:MAG: hypothetical protein EPO24_08970 [Bacteroidota bacterium]
MGYAICVPHCKLLFLHCLLALGFLFIVPCSMLSAHNALPTAQRSTLTAHRPPLTTLGSQPSAPCSKFHALSSTLYAQNSTLTAHCSPPTAHRPLPTAHRPLLVAPTQQDTSKPRVDSLHIQSDTIAVSDTTQDTTKQSYKPFVPTKSALLAVGLSAALPGAGQVYNETYWKVPVIWGLGGYWVYEWITLNRSYKDYGNQFNQSVIDSPPLGDDNLKKQRDFYRDERDKFAWYLGALYFLNVVDAYVGANLYDFEVTPDLGPNPSQSFQFRGTFRVGF